MKLPAILERVPTVMIIVLLPALAFLVAVGFTLGTSNNGSEEAQADPPALDVQVSNVTNAQAQPTAVVAATATAVPVRTDCAAIRGSDYRSPEERDWFQKNCLGTAQAASSSEVSNAGAASTTPARSTTSNSSSQGSAQGATPSAPAVAAPPAPAVSTAQTPSGQRLVIPAAGINADIYVTVMQGSIMPDPHGYFNVLAYDMSALGLGGDMNAGNLVLSGHVDCGRCYNGGAGAAVLWSVRELGAGASAQVYAADGRIVNYVVTNSVVYSAGLDFASIVAPGAADMTIITCTGTFAGGHYDNRHVVQFRKV